MEIKLYETPRLDSNDFQIFVRNNLKKKFISLSLAERKKLKMSRHAWKTSYIHFSYFCILTFLFLPDYLFITPHLSSNCRLSTFSLWELCNIEHIFLNLSKVETHLFCKCIWKYQLLILFLPMQLYENHVDYKQTIEIKART